MPGLKQLGVVLIVGMAMTASAQRRWGGPQRSDSPRSAFQQQPSSQPRQDSRRQDRQHDRQSQTPQSQPVRPKTLLPGRGMQNSDSQQPRHGDWLRKHGDMPPQEQQKALESDPAFRALAPQDQERLRQRLNWFNSLPPDRREQVMRRHEIIENMTPQQRAQARDLFQRFQNLPESRRKVMDFYFRNLRNMSPEERQRVMDSQQFRSQFSDEEQNIMRGMTDLNLGPSRAGEGAPPDD